jgi:hypothetical protein
MQKLLVRDEGWSLCCQPIFASAMTLSNHTPSHCHPLSNSQQKGCRLSAAQQRIAVFHQWKRSPQEPTLQQNLLQKARQNRTTQVDSAFTMTTTRHLSRVGAIQGQESQVLDSTADPHTFSCLCKRRPVTATSCPELVMHRIGRCNLRCHLKKRKIWHERAMNGAGEPSKGAEPTHSKRLLSLHTECHHPFWKPQCHCQLCHCYLLSTGL